MDVPAITRREAHALRLAAVALRAIDKRASERARDSRNGLDARDRYYYGRLAGEAGMAEDHLFDVATSAAVYLEAPAAERVSDAKAWLR